MTIDKGILLSLSTVLTLILNMKTTLLALSIIIIIDMITGIRKSLHKKRVKIRLHKKEFWMSISSSGIRNTWRKTYEYVIGILAFSVLDGMVLGSTSFQLLGQPYSIAELAVAIACIVEIYSIYENMEAVSGNNLFKKMIKIFPQRIKGVFVERKKNV